MDNTVDTWRPTLGYEGARHEARVFYSPASAPKDTRSQPAIAAHTRASRTPKSLRTSESLRSK
jgi:hypothetical protein